MANDIYFEVFWLNESKQKAGGLAVQIPHDDSVPPGERIKAFTEVVRSMRTSQPRRLKTEIHTVMPADVVVRSLNEYLWLDDNCNTGRFMRHLQNLIEDNTIHRFIPRIGVVVIGHDLVGRKEKISELLLKLRSNQSCHLRASRRYGKTSILLSLKEHIENALFIEVSDVRSSIGLLKGLLKVALVNKKSHATLLRLQAFKSWPSYDALRDTTLFNHMFRTLTEPSESIERLIHDSLSALADTRTYLLVDEFSVVLREMHENSCDELKRFLEIFRNIRKRKENPLTVVLAGSSGLSAYIEFFNLKQYFDDFSVVDLPPISEKDAKVLIEELFYGMDKIPSPGVIDSVMLHTGQREPIPYFIQALVNETIMESGTQRKLSENHVADAYYNGLLGPRGNNYFRDFFLRERIYPKTCKPCASAVLKTLARQFPHRVSESVLRDYFTNDCVYEKLMSCLEEDYDLVRSENEFRLRSKVLADRWRLGEPWLTKEGVPCDY